jgi:hypothetical protein
MCTGVGVVKGFAKKQGENVRGTVEVEAGSVCRGPPFSRGFKPEES